MSGGIAGSAAAREDALFCTSMKSDALSEFGAEERDDKKATEGAKRPGRRAIGAPLLAQESQRPRFEPMEEAR
jgi:hypothetical protein